MFIKFWTSLKFTCGRFLMTGFFCVCSTVLNNDRRQRERAALGGGDIAGVVAMDVEILRVRPSATESN